MDSFDGTLIQERALPGILILNQHNELVFLNNEARSILDSTLAQSADGVGQAQPPIPEEVYKLCEALRRATMSQEDEELPCLYSQTLINGVLYSLRAVPLFKSLKDITSPSHTLVHIEKCVTKRRLDLEKIKSKFELTDREAQVVFNIVNGAANQEIADNLFISEHTVKDHIKKVMKKLDAKSRTMIIKKVME